MNGAVSLVFSCLNRRMAYYKDLDKRSGAETERENKGHASGD